MYLKIELALKISILYLARSSHAGTKVVFILTHNMKTLKMVWSTKIQKLSQAQEGTKGGAYSPCFSIACVKWYKIRTRFIHTTAQDKAWEDGCSGQHFQVQEISL